MKISDLYEDKKKDEYNDQLKQTVMDVMVMYNVTGTSRTNINNIISELNKNDISMDVETIADIVTELGFEVEGEDVLFSDNDTVEVDDLSDGEDFDEVGSLAKQATDKRMK